MPSKMRKDIYILVKDRTFIRSASFPRVMTHFYFSLPRESIFMISFYSSFFVGFLHSNKNYEEKSGPEKHFKQPRSTFIIESCSF